MASGTNFVDCYCDNDQTRLQQRQYRTPLMLGSINHEHYVGKYVYHTRPDGAFMQEQLLKQN